MMQRLFFGLRASLPLVLGLGLAAGLQAQLTVLGSGGFATAFEELRPQFEKSHQVKITVLRGASQGPGPNTIPAQLRRGVQADMVIMSREGLEELVAEGRIAVGSQRDLASSPLGLAVKEGAARPDISTVEAFRQTLLRAKSIGVQSSSEIYMKSKLLPRLGIEAAILPKLNGGGAPAIAAGETEMAVLPVSELLNKPGVAFIGPVPAEIQMIQPFSAAVLKDAKAAELAKQLIAFLASAEARAAIRRSGMEPLGGR